MQLNHPYRFEYANFLSSRYRPSPSLEFVRVGAEVIQPSSSVRNLGVILDPSIDIEDHIKKICKTCHFHLTNISKIRSYLDRESTEAIIHAFVTANLDYCNAILYGLPEVHISCSSSYSLRFCSDKLLLVPRSKLKSYGDRRFSIAGTKLWNSIPASLRNADSLNSLKKTFKDISISPRFFLIYK